MAGFSGGCLCGAVRYQSSADPAMMGHCHCVDCRKSSGTGHCSHMIVPVPSVAITGKLSTYERAADSGALVTRAFCPNCGSAIYSTNAAQPGVIFIRASSLDDPEIFRPQVVVYASRRASWDSIAGDLPTFEHMPPAPG